MIDEQGHPNPKNCQSDQSQPGSPALLEHHCPQTKEGDNQRYLLFTCHRKNSKNKEPDCLPRVHEIQRIKQQRGCECDSMKIKVRRLLLRGIQQIQQSNTNSSELVTKAQACQPEGRKCAARHNYLLDDIQHF